MDDRPSNDASGDVIYRPQLAHIREENDSDEELLEATELRSVNHNNHNQDSTKRLSRVLSPELTKVHWNDPIRKLWRHNIRISVPHEDCRDHLANERTFLAFLRTSGFLSMVGTMIAQLYRLWHQPHPSKIFGYFLLGKPLAAIFQIAAALVALLGCVRFFRQQDAMALGRVHAGGWEMIAIGIGSFMLLLMMFGVHIAVDVYKQITETP